MLTQQVVQIGKYSYHPNLILGQGTTATVHLGFRNSDQAPVAVKIIRISQVNTPVKKHLLASELQALASVKSRYVCQPWEILKDGQFYFIPMEFCSGGTLRAYIKTKGRLAQGQALGIFQKILEGYKSIREAGFIHRDLKTDNILLRPGLGPAIIDFGYCQNTRAPDLPQPYNVGSPAYMSPEAYNHSSYSQKSDIWALGVVLHEMLTGTIPKIRTGDIDEYFWGLASRTQAEIVAQGLSQGVLGVLGRCLAVSVQGRVGIDQLRGCVAGLRNQGQAVKQHWQQGKQNQAYQKQQQPSHKSVTSLKPAQRALQQQQPLGFQPPYC